VDLFELGLGGFVARVDIWVILARQLPIGLLDLCVAGASLDTQGFVVIVVIHSEAPPQNAIDASESSACDLTAWRGGSESRAAPSDHHVTDNCKVIGLTRYLRYGRSQRYFIFFLFFVFSLCERKNEKQIKEKYLAAAGKTALESATA